MFVKAVDPAHKDLIKLTSGLFHEPRLFNSTSICRWSTRPSTPPSIDEADEDFILVMEDLTARGADPRDATRPLTVEQAADGVRGLARMHGRFWGQRSQTARAGLAGAVRAVGGHGGAPLHAALEAIGDDAPGEVHGTRPSTS